MWFEPRVRVAVTVAEYAPDCADSRVTLTGSMVVSLLPVCRTKRLGSKPSQFVREEKFECWFPVGGQDAHSKCSYRTTAFG